MKHLPSNGAFCPAAGAARIFIWIWICKLGALPVYILRSTISCTAAGGPGPCAAVRGRRKTPRLQKTLHSTARPRANHTARGSPKATSLRRRHGRASSDPVHLLGFCPLPSPPGAVTLRKNTSYFVDAVWKNTTRTTALRLCGPFQLLWCARPTPNYWQTNPKTDVLDRAISTSRNGSATLWRR